MSNTESVAERLVHQWVEQCVIDLSLCPFAAVPYRSGRVRIVICPDRDESGQEVLSDEEAEAEYLLTINAELSRLIDEPSLETTLIASERALPDFLDFNDFLGAVEELLQQRNRDSNFQLASFHPQYRFADVDENDAGNYTNRAPYPIVQWLRTDTVAKAVESTNTLAIPEANIQKLKKLGSNQLRQLFPWVE